MMTQLPSPPPRHPERTPAQHAAVRRRSLPVAVVANLLALGALAMLLSRTIAVHTPPDAIAGLITYSVILMGVGILFYAKGTSRTTLARGLSIAATLVGMVGVAVYYWQGVHMRLLQENADMQHVADIARAADKFAREHDGAYPQDLAALLAAQYLSQETLLSPFGGQGTQYLMDMKHTGKSPIKMSPPADYTYVGGDLHLPLPPAAAQAMVVDYETDPVMRQYFTVAFADGTPRMLTQHDATKVLQACNDARATLGLPPLKQPESIERATTGESPN